VIVVDPELGPIEGNLLGLDGSERCPHLRGDAPPFSCAIHDYEWFPDTPCGRHGQIEKSPDDPCRMGDYQLKRRAK